MIKLTLVPQNAYLGVTKITVADWSDLELIVFDFTFLLLFRS
jgi:hypothetical protein